MKCRLLFETKEESEWNSDLRKVVVYSMDGRPELVSVTYWYSVNHVKSTRRSLFVVSRPYINEKLS